MRKVILILALMLGVTLFAQNSKGESNNISLFTAPGTYIDLGDWIQPNYSDDGFNFGVQYEYQNRTIYVSPQIFVFPDLNGYDYIHVIGRFGFNKEWGFYNKFRVFAGGRAGRIYRETAGFNYALLGAEIGCQYTFNGGLFFQITGSTNSKTDSKLWGSDDSHTVNSVDIGVGIRF